MSASICCVTCVYMCSNRTLAEVSLSSAVVLLERISSEAQSKQYDSGFNNCSVFSTFSDLGCNGRTHWLAITKNYAPNKDWYLFPLFFFL